MTPPVKTIRPDNDTSIAAKQRAASTLIQQVLSPLEARMEKAFMAFRGKPMLKGFCNLFERNLTFDLDSQSYVWGDRLRLNTQLLQEIETSARTEDQKNEDVFWLTLFHTTYFILGYQNRLATLATGDLEKSHAAFTQATLQQITALGIAQPAPSATWTQFGYEFEPLASIAPSARLEDEIIDHLNNGSLTIAGLTSVPMLQFSQLEGVAGNVADYAHTEHDTFAKDMLNEWVDEFSKGNTFGESSVNGIRLMFFKSKPPRDASEAISDCLQSKYPVSDDLALYNNKKLANDYFAPRKADPIVDKTGHIEMFIVCSGSISAGDIGDCVKVFYDFFAKRKRKMTYAISTFDTGIMSRIVVREDENPVDKLKELAIIGGGGTDFRCIAAKLKDMTDQGDPGPNGKPFKCDLAVMKGHGARAVR